MKRTQEEILELYDKYYDMVWRICFMQLGNIQDAYDGTQETFIRLMGYSKPFHDKEHEKAWMIRTAVNYCKDILKSGWRKNQIHVDLTEIVKNDSVTDCIDGDWSLRIPYKVDPEAVDRYNIDKVCGKKCEISHVDVSDEQIVVYSNKNYGIQVFDQNGNEIQGFYAGSESNNRAVAFPIDADTRENISVLKVYAFSRTKDGLDRYMKSSYDERTEKAAKELSDISATVKLEK